jgi:hypothetical protein
MDLVSMKGVNRRQGKQGDHAGQPLELRWERGLAIVSAPDWDDVSWETRLFLMASALSLFVVVAESPKATLTWLFSGKVTRQPDALEILKQWSVNDKPPVFHLIDFVEDDDILRTTRATSVGLREIVGHEVDVLLGPDITSELPSVMYAMAHSALTTGPIEFSQMTGPSGSKYALAWVDDIPGHLIVRATETMRIGNLMPMVRGTC